MENVVNFRKAGLRPLVCATAIFLLFNSSFAQNFSGGNGTYANPYLISTAADLAQLATLVNAGDTAYNNKQYKLANNINLSAYGAGFNNGKGWIPIGKYNPLNNAPFKGAFEGDSNVITGLYINDTTLSGAGLFGSIEGAVRNLSVDSVNIRGGLYVGGVAGHIYGSGLWDCSSSGNIVGNQEVGGLVGRLFNGNLSNCYSSCNVSGTLDCVGGIAGWVENVCRISNCYSTGDVTGNVNVGGIAGMLSYASTILYCYSTGNVTGNQYVGGIAGYVSGSSLINCYSTSNITANRFSGGILGEVTDALCAKGQIINCVALNPSVIGNSNAGRVMGNNSSECTINNTAYDSVLTKAGDVIWNNKATDNLDGDDISKEAINEDGTFDGKFKSTDGWTTQNGKLPGLFGKTVDMPPHLRMSGEVGVVEPHNYAALQVYPNPTKRQLTIESVDMKIERVEILDILGQCVFTTPNPSKGGESSTSAQFPSFGGAGVVIDVSHLAAGMYFLKAGNRVAKFVKE